MRVCCISRRQASADAPVFRTGPGRVGRVRAFTLVELLTVIGIIAVLAALLFPVFSAARQSSHRTVCGSNLHQVGATTVLYLQDYDDTYPSALNPWDKAYPEDSDYMIPDVIDRVDDFPLFADVLQPYCKSREIFHCPSDSGYMKGSVAVKPSAYKFFGASYDLVQLFHAEKESCWSKPAELVYGRDTNDHWHANDEAVYEDKTRTCLYYDWHIKFISQSQYHIGYYCGKD